MILEALIAYYMAALSKRDLKPFLKFKTFLLGFAGCCFFQKFPPEAQLNHETYVLVRFHESQKAIYYIGTKIPFGSSVSHKPIENWEIENVKT